MSKGVTGELNEMLANNSPFSLVQKIASRAKEIMETNEYSPEASSEKTPNKAISAAIKEEYEKKNSAA